jgi:hypothetical protein
MPEAVVNKMNELAGITKTSEVENEETELDVESETVEPA